MRPTLAAVFAVLCSIANPAQAQVTVDLLRVGDRTPNTYSLPINAAECDADLAFTVRLTSLPTDKNTLVVVYGVNCENGGNRTGSGSVVNRTCFDVTTADLSGTAGQLDLTLTAQDLDCDEMDEVVATRNVYFVALSAANAVDDVGTDSYVKLDIEIDTKPPPAPTSVEAGAGQTTIPVSWSFTSTDVNRFLIYWDPTDQDCSSSRLVAGEPVDENDSTLRSVTASLGSRSRLVSSPVEIGQSARVGVVAVDLAGNQSVLSNVACLTGIPTSGFWDLYLASGGDAETGCSVSMLGRPQTGQLAWILGACASAIWWIRRRRHS